MSQHSSQAEPSQSPSGVAESPSENGTAPAPFDLPPVRVEVGYKGSGPTGRVVITEVTPQSTHVLELSPESAAQIGLLMAQCAAKVSSGLILPPTAL
jgi:hypothetical protein